VSEEVSELEPITKQFVPSTDLIKTSDTRFDENPFGGR
jgi:hypothetical protein